MTLGLRGNVPGLDVSKAHDFDVDVTKLYERFVPRPSDEQLGLRSAVRKDRDRLIHSSALRRLQGKSQIVGQLSDFFRTRLTHSLECAQIGRSLAERAGNAAWGTVVERFEDLADVVEAACLAHDLGHPPFGHNGEEALNDEMRARNSSFFEGNAQSFRIVTYGEAKVFGASLAGSDRWSGLNLTRTTLRATIKYPWSETDIRAREKGKFGVYDDAVDREYFEWIWNAKTPSRTLAAEIMDASDDIAYAVHDFEDGIWSGMIPLHELMSSDEEALKRLEAEVLARDRKRHKPVFSTTETVEAALRAVLEPLDGAYWAEHPFDRSRQSRAYLKNYTAQLIHFFIHGLTDGRLFTPPADDVRRRLDVLTGAAWVWMIRRSDLLTTQYGQRKIIRELFDGYWKEPRMLPRVDEWAETNAVSSPKTRRFPRRDERWPEKARLIRDHIAGMTDSYALAVHNQMYGGARNLDLHLTY
jgi:dGTPase